MSGDEKELKEMDAGTVIVTEEILDENPDLAKAGVNLGDEIDTCLIAQDDCCDEGCCSESDEPKLEEGVKMKIELSLFENGEVEMQILSEEQPSVVEVLGSMDLAKSRFVQSMMEPTQPQQAPVNTIVSVELTQDDFDLDPHGQLAADGHKIGDVIQIPEQVAMLRQMAIQRLHSGKGTAESVDSQTIIATQSPETGETQGVMGGKIAES